MDDDEKSMNDAASAEEGKSKKKKLREGCLEAVGELFIEILFVAIGAGVLALFGFGIDFEKLDSDALALIGIGAVLAVGLAVGGVIWLIKHKNAAKKQNEPNNDGNSLEKDDNSHDNA